MLVFASLRKATVAGPRGISVDVGETNDRDDARLFIPVEAPMTLLSAMECEKTTMPMGTARRWPSMGSSQ